MTYVSTLVNAGQQKERALPAGVGDGVTQALNGGTLPTDAAHRLALCESDSLPALCRAAAELRDRGKGRIVTFSPKVFIPLTRLCRDFCRYCTFRQSPLESESLFMTIEVSLITIRDLHQRYGHIQEVIIQNFRAKPDTAMRAHPHASNEATLWTVAVTRLILGPRANIQVPPNLNRTDYPTYLMAGINDWGGVSPVTIDYVNPEAPWPHLGHLRAQTERLGFQLKPRLLMCRFWR